MATPTHTDDRTFDLISVAYHALQAAETHEQYIRDAEGRGDQEAADFFRETQQQHNKTADRAKQLMQSRLAEG
ncbi:MAG: hypothetical protein M3N04_02405 [Actinomycetota bacterium]|nr:hypothetical protein [Actinomycetota bacterium]